MKPQFDQPTTISAVAAIQIPLTVSPGAPEYSVIHVEGAAVFLPATHG
jgi:hypothetical protein